MSVVTMRKLLESGVHFGHQTRRWNPKMKPNIYASRNGVYIINLEKTLEQLDTAYAAMKDIAEKGGKVLFVGTKKQAQAVVVEEALRSGSFFVNQRWLGGLLTNYRTIQKRVKRLVEIEEMEANGTLDLYPCLLYTSWSGCLPTSSVSCRRQRHMLWSGWVPIIRHGIPEFIFWFRLWIVFPIR